VALRGPGAGLKVSTRALGNERVNRALPSDPPLMTRVWGQNQRIRHAYYWDKASHTHTHRERETLHSSSNRSPFRHTYSVTPALFRLLHHHHHHQFIGSSLENGDNM